MLTSGRENLSNQFTNPPCISPLSFSASLPLQPSLPLLPYRLLPLRPSIALSLALARPVLFVVFASPGGRKLPIASLVFSAKSFFGAPLAATSASVALSLLCQWLPPARSRSSLRGRRGLSDQILLWRATGRHRGLRRVATPATTGRLQLA
jgi:hypothetical protein